MADRNFYVFMSEKYASDDLHRDPLQDDQALLDDSALLDTTRVRSDERWTASKQTEATLLDSHALLDTSAILSDERWLESHRYETQLTDSSSLLDNRTLLDASAVLGPPPSPPLVFRIKRRFDLPPTMHIHDLTGYLAREPCLALPNPFEALLEAPIPEPFHVALRLLASGKTRISQQLKAQRSLESFTVSYPMHCISPPSSFCFRSCSPLLLLHGVA